MLSDMFLKIEQKCSIFVIALMIEHDSISGAWAKGLCLNSLLITSVFLTTCDIVDVAWETAE